MPPSQNTPRKFLGEILVDAGLITRQQLMIALKEQRRHGGRIGFNLVRLGFLTAVKLCEFLEQNFGVAIIGEKPAERQKAADVVPRHLALYYKIAPLRLENNVLTVAIADVEHPNLMAVLAEITGCKVDPLVYPEDQIRSLLDSVYKVPADSGVEFFAFGDHVFTIVDNRKTIKALALSQLSEKQDVSEWLRSVIAEAIKEKSREILIKPEAEGSFISFKKDTFLLSEYSLTSAMHDDITFLLFRLSKMNPMQQQKPQHGRFLVRIHDRKIVMVASAFPTIYGMRFLLEMFDEKLLKRSFDEIMTPLPGLKSDLEDFMLRSRNGMCLITGPEGSGRTPFLYSFLSKCKDHFREIITLENAVRYPLSGISQTQVPENEMESALENVLKQKPDLIAVNCLRTVRAAEIAFLIAARITVIAVLSSYDSFVAIDWLCRHKLKSAIKAGLLHTIVSPRMIPRVCPNCSVAYELSPSEKEEWKLPDGAELKMNTGCDYCKNTDAESAEAVFEHFQINPDVISWTENNHSSSALRLRARQAGVRTLFDLVLPEAFHGNLDMPSVLKLQAPA